MDNLTNAYSTHQKLKALNELKNEQNFSIKINFYAQVFFTIATWIIYLLFAAAMYAAPLWVLQSFFGANAGNVLAIVILSVFLFVFPTALALGKHAGYHALSKRGVDIRYVGLIVAFFIASGIYLEMTSASSQQQEKANQAVETSNAGKAIMGTQVNNTASTGYASLIAEAQLKYDRCLVKLSEGKEKHCNGDKGKLDSLKNQANLEREAVNSANTAAIAEKQKALQAERDAQALPIAKMFQEALGSTIATGAIVAAFIAALIFEISHSLTIFNEQKLNRERESLVKLLNETETLYFSETGKQYDGADFKESEILDLAEMRKSGKVQHFNDRLSDVEPASQPAPEHKPSFGFGFVPAQPANARRGDNTPPAPSCVTQKRGTANPLNDNGTRDSSAGTRNSSAGTRTDTHGNTPKYTAFSQIPSYPEGKCKWCGADLHGLRKGTKFCESSHKDLWWNLYKPSNKRSVRANHS